MLMAIRYRRSATWRSLMWCWTASSPMRTTCDRLLVEPCKRQAYCVRRQDSLRATVRFSVGVLELMSYHLLNIVPRCGRQQLTYICHCMTEYSTLRLALAVMLALIWLIGGVLVLCRCFGRFCMIVAIQCTQWMMPGPHARSRDTRGVGRLHELALQPLRTRTRQFDRAFLNR